MKVILVTSLVIVLLFMDANLSEAADSKPKTNNNNLQLILQSLAQVLGFRVSPVKTPRPEIKPLPGPAKAPPPAKPATPAPPKPTTSKPQTPPKDPPKEDHLCKEFPYSKTLPIKFEYHHDGHEKGLHHQPTFEETFGKEIEFPTYQFPSDYKHELKKEQDKNSEKSKDKENEYYFFIPPLYKYEYVPDIKKKGDGDNNKDDILKTDKKKEDDIPEYYYYTPQEYKYDKFEVKKKDGEKESHVNIPEYYQYTPPEYKYEEHPEYKFEIPAEIKIDKKKEEGAQLHIPDYYHYTPPEYKHEEHSEFKFEIPSEVKIDKKKEDSKKKEEGAQPHIPDYYHYIPPEYKHEEHSEFKFEIPSEVKIDKKKEDSKKKEEGAQPHIPDYYHYTPPEYKHEEHSEFKFEIPSEVKIDKKKEEGAQPHNPEYFPYTPPEYQHVNQHDYENDYKLLKEYFKSPYYKNIENNPYHFSHHKGQSNDEKKKEGEAVKEKSIDNGVPPNVQLSHLISESELPLSESGIHPPVFDPIVMGTSPSPSHAQVHAQVERMTLNPDVNNREVITVKKLRYSTSKLTMSPGVDHESYIQHD